MKFLAKLCQLRKKKNDFFVRVALSYDNFYNLKDVELFDIIKKEEFVYLKLKYYDYIKLKKLNIFEKENDEIKTYIITNRNKLIISFIITVAIFIIFILNNFFVRKIEFKDKKYYNEEIYECVLNYSKKIGKYYFFKDTINHISVELREKYYQYAYIGLLKRGSKVLIEIETQTIKSEENKSNNLIGEYVSKADGTIEKIKIESGNVLVKYNEVVKKDQILVTSNLLYNENLFSKDKIVPLKGYVIARTREYKEISVLKEEYIKIITNIDKKKYNISYKNNKNYNQNNKFTKEYNVFKIGNFYLKKKITYNEEIIKVERNLNDALEYAKYLIYIEYINSFLFEEEEIISIDIIKIDENGNEFCCVFLVCSKQNIAIFNEKI